MFRISTVVYGVMAVLGLAILYWGHETLEQVFAVPKEPLRASRLVLTGLLGAGLLMILSYFFEDWFPSFRSLKSAITRLLGPCSVFMAFYLALVSAVGEEVLFRGAIQPFAGLVVTSILFGLLHMGPDGRISAWSLWAMLAGLLLGWMFNETGSLWPPIIAHFGVNAVSILRLRRAYRKWMEGQAPEPGLEPEDGASWPPDADS